MKTSIKVRDLYKMAARDTRVASQEYWYNTSFVSGNQWLLLDTASDQVRELPQDDRLRHTVNRMGTNHRTLIANLMQRAMAWEVLPSGDSDGAAAAAHISEEILYGLAYDHNWETLREKYYVNTLKGGTSGVSVDWDERSGDTVEQALSIVEMAVEPGVLDAARANWWIKAQVHHPEKVQDMLGLSWTPTTDAANGINPLADRLYSAFTGSEKVNPLTLVLTYYERPNPGNEDGRVVVEVNSKKIQDIPWPFPFNNRLNLAVGVETLVSDQWFGETIYSAARGPQILYNLAKSNLAEHLRDTAQAKLLIPNSSIQLLDTLNDIPGNMYPYPDSMRPPEWLTPPQLANWLQTLPNDYMADIDDIMGVHDVSRGKAPVNLESGTALSILAELDGTPVGRMLKEGARVFSEVGSMVLEMQQAFSQNQRLSVIDHERGPLSLSWTGKDIDGQTRAQVPLDSVIPRSRAAMQQMGMKLLEMGLIPDLETFFRIIEMPGRRDVVTAVNPDAAKARRENSKMLQGHILNPAKFDDHPIHIKEHNDGRKTTAYENASPDYQEEYDKHVLAHDTLAAEAMAGQVARSQQNPVLGGAPRADGTPPVDPELAVGPPPAGPPPEGPAGPPEQVIDDPGSMVDQLMNEI